MSEIGVDPERIARAGGWRIFMRSSAPELSNTLMRAGHCGHSQSDPVAIARAFVLAKHGLTREARRIVDGLQAKRASGEETDPQLWCEVVLVDAHVRVYEDRPLSEREAEHLSRALEVLRPEDLVGQALALNQLCVFSLHMGHFDRAQEYAESAIRLYRQGGAEFGSLHLHAHLGQIKLMRGDLEGAEAQYAEMERRLAKLAEDTDALLAVSRALRSEVAYEMNSLGRSQQLLTYAMTSVEEDDAWLDVRAAAYRVRTRLAYARSGLPGALTELAHCETVAKRRTMPRLQWLMQVERIRALTLSNELDPALSLMRSIGLMPEQHDWEHSEDWALRQGTSAVAIARWLVRARRAPEALALIEPAEDFAIRGGQLLPLAKLRVVRASAHWKRNQKADATAALLSALRLLGRQPFRRFILDEGRDMRVIVQAALDGDHVALPPNPEQRRRLSELMHSWTTNADGRVLERAGTEHDPSGHEPHRHRYLELLAIGLSNKEIGRTMGVSVNTVKYHLKHIFRELRVDNRTRAVAEAQRLGTISSQHPSRS